MQISGFVLKRILQLILISLIVAFITFWLASVIPGDFFSTHLLDPSIQKGTVEQMRHRYGLDQPFYIQFLHWLGRLLRLDLGYSLFYQRPVSSIVADALANTLWIGVPALVLGFGVGIILGAANALFERRLPGRILDLFSTIALSLPSLLLGLAALLFAASTHWFPLGSMNSLGVQGAGIWRWMADRLYHLLLPVACLTIPVMAYVQRIQRAAVQGAGLELYVRSARARGLGARRIFFHYVVRPGLNPVLSVAGPMLGGILSGSLVLEVIFAWPGLGQITYDALFNNDLFLLAGCVMGSSLLLVVGNLLADFALMALDPRTRSSIRKSAP
ncbi:MAG: ABC transporter permease [Acidobacteriota bacterium]|jgi:peptide/nickel transport system permease protein